jgi:hypothetical protein
MLRSVGNPNAQSNSDVVVPYLVADDITGRPMDRFIVDFQSMPQLEAAGYEGPYGYIGSVRDHRAAMSQPEALETWWLHWRSRPEMRVALSKLDRFIATPRVAKHRLFVWIRRPTLVDNAVVAFARSDDTSFGILHSKIHAVWALRLGTTLEDRPRYTSTTSFQTFPFPIGLAPNLPEHQYANDPRAQRIAHAAIFLNTQRENWLNPIDWVDRTHATIPGYPDRFVPKNDIAAKELKKRTLTNLYNANPPWLQHAHRELDEAVADAYGFSWPLSDDEILRLLFELNRQSSNNSSNLVAAAT